MKYFEIVENNDWEGEQWTFFIPESSNREFVAKLRNAIAKFGIDSENFEIKDELATGTSCFINV